VFGGPLFEIVLALFFVFLTMSALVSFLQELVIQTGRWRSRSLRHGIYHMLGDDAHYRNRIAQRFFRHPLVTALGGRRSNVTHIDAETFVVALATAVLPKGTAQDAVSALPQSVAALAEGELKRRLTLVLPPAEASADRELIKAAVTAWFNTSVAKMGERYKADGKALSYIIAAGATVLFNVSPIEIGQRLMADDALRTGFASVVPELSSTLFSSGQGIPVALSGSPNAADADLSDGELTRIDAGKLLSIYHCSRSKIDLPIGWHWMGDVLTDLRNSDLGAIARLPSDSDACLAATSDLGEGSQLAQRLNELQNLGISTQTAAPKYGPDFGTDSPALILVGWLIMVFAAAQGAPFWFDLLKKLVRR